jgi:hypothetical protein
VAPTDPIEAVVKKIASVDSWNRRVALIREIPEQFGKAKHQDIYAAVARAIYVSELAPDFAYIHWRDEYELKPIDDAYQRAFDLTKGFTLVQSADLARVIRAEPTTVRIFRLLLGLTTQEFAASTAGIASQLNTLPISNGSVKSMENGRLTSAKTADVIASVIDKAMRGELFAERVGGVRSKITKPDTVLGWESVRTFATNNVPFPVFLHQRHYGGAFRQLLDATSGKRGDLLEQIVERLFSDERILFVRTGSGNQSAIAGQFGLTVQPAQDFVVHDSGGVLRAILECKQANDGGTARDKAARFSTLRNEAVRLGGVPLFAVLAGLGWRRAADTLGPVVRDTDGRVFTIQTLPSMMTVEPFPGLRA